MENYVKKLLKSYLNQNLKMNPNLNLQVQMKTQNNTVKDAKYRHNKKDYKKYIFYTIINIMCYLNFQ